MDLLNNNQEDQLSIDPAKDYLTEYTGPGGKFHKEDPQESLKALARAKAESDAYIAIQNKRMDDLRRDYLELRETANTGPKLQEQIDRLLALQQNSNDDTMSPHESQEKPVYDPKEIESLFEAKLQQHELTKKQEENFRKVESKLKEKFGDNFASVLKQQVDSMPGITPAEVNDLARKSPDAFFRLMGLDRQEDGSFQAPPRSNQRNDNFSPNAQKRDEAYYDKLRKDNPKVYYDPKTQVQMHKDAQTLGAQFFKDGRI